MRNYLNVASVCPELRLAQPKENLDIYKNILHKLKKDNIQLAVFPELGVTGYTCEDLFHQQELLVKVYHEIQAYISTNKSEIIHVIGTPFQNYDGRIYNVALVILKDKILGMIPKIHLPNYNEFYEKRWFTSGLGVHEKITAFGQTFLFSSNQLFKFGDTVLGVEICEDVWAPNPPSVNLALNGANVIVNLSASNELVNKSQYRKDLIEQHSSRLNCAYIYSSAGTMESSKDVVFGGHCFIFENGSLLAENKRFNFETNIIYSSVDLDKLLNERRKNNTFMHSQKMQNCELKIIESNFEVSKIYRTYSPTPFIPTSNDQLVARTEEIFSIQSSGLARRLFAINKPKIVLGLSGGLDSTLALLVALESVKVTKQDVTDIVCITMPGFGTTSRTKSQAQILAESVGVSFLDIPIGPSVLEHFKAIGHDINDTSVVYENAQARERTQILFDYANKINGIVLGTGDLSELALGWCTYNGDHMSSYNVNASIPKTLVKHLVSYYANYRAEDKKVKKVLLDIVDTKISPELLPADAKGEIAQETEEIIGPYLLHDFFLFHKLRNGFSYEKILFVAKLAFDGKYKEDEINKWLLVFKKRFAMSQFKRTTLPAGPKVGSVSLSPRGDWRCPDEC